MTRALRFPRRSRFSRWLKNAALLATLVFVLITWFREETQSASNFPSLPPSAKSTLPPGSKATRFSAKVIAISDGDTIRVLDDQKQTLRVRLQGIDAPEDRQEYGNASRRALANLIAGQQVELQVTGKDRYDRRLAWIYLNGENINRRMVADGWAWHYVEYDKDVSLAQLQRDARAASKGLWNSTAIPIAPWEYRSLQRSGNLRPSGNTPPRGSSSSFPTNRFTEAPQPAAKQAEGEKKAYWMNPNGDIRHNRSCRWYGRTARGHYTHTQEGNACGICKG